MHPSLNAPSLLRRRLLAGLALAPLGIRAAHAEADRTLTFFHLHTHEQLSVTYFADGAYVPESLNQVDLLLRDFRTGDVHPIDPALLDILHAVSAACGTGTFHIISGYRSPVTNAALADQSDGVSRHSLHLEGRAIDVRLAGRSTRRVRDAGLALRLGGVGYYPGSDFVHLDTGRVRSWGPA